MSLQGHINPVYLPPTQTLVRLLPQTSTNAHPTFNVLIRQVYLPLPCSIFSLHTHRHSSLLPSPSPNHHRHTSSHLSPLTLTPPIPTHTHPTYPHSHSPHLPPLTLFPLSPLTLIPPISTHTHPTYLHSHSPHLSPLTLTPPRCSFLSSPHNHLDILAHMFH